MINTDSKYSRAFSEVIFILNSLDKGLYELIPTAFIKLIKDNMDEDYVVTKEHLNTVGMLPETKAILSLIYRDFFISDSARDELKEADKEALAKEEKSYENIFKKDAKNVSEESTDLDKNGEENTQLIVKKEEKWYKKIFRKILGFFGSSKGES